MTIDKIKSIVKESMGKTHSFIFYGARNQNDQFKGVITAMYPAIFVVKVNDYQIRTFSYSDLLINNLEILD